jgi:hypothetical protein
MTTREDDFTDLALARRLRSIQMGQTPASALMSFDLGAGLDDDIAGTLEGSGAIPGGKPSGLGSFLSSLTSDPSKVPVGDLSKFSERLKALGYLDHDYSFQGVDSTFSSAVRKYGDDRAAEIRQGHGSKASITARKGLDLLNATMPSSIFKGLVGAVKGLAKSAWGTTRRWNFVDVPIGDMKIPIPTIGMGAPLINLSDAQKEGHFKQTLNEYKQHLPEDAINFITAASLASGVGEAVAGAEALAGSTAGLGAKAALRLGAEEGTSLLAKPAEEVLLSSRQGLGSKLAQNIIGRFSKAGADSFAEWALKYGPRAQQQRPLLRLLGDVYGGLSKAAFVPNAAAILNVNSAVARETKKAPQAPWWVDLSTLALAPEKGLIPKPWKMFNVRDIGYMDPFRGLPGGAPDDVGRAATYVQAYQKNRAVEAMTALPNWEEIRREGGAVQHKAYSEALATETHKALIDAELPSRGVDPEYTKKAIEWAASNPLAVRRHLLELHAGAQSRIRLGLTGFNPEEDYRSAEELANNLTHSMVLESEPVKKADKEVEGLRKLLLKAGAKGDVAATKRISDRISQVEYDASQFKLSTAVREHEVGLASTKRILPQRLDNPMTRENIQRVLDEYRGGAGALPSELHKDLETLGLGTVPDGKIESHLETLLEHAPRDLSEHLPTYQVEAFRELGFRPVAGGHDVILRSDFNPAAISLPKYSKGAYLWASLGLSPKPEDSRQISMLAKSTMAESFEDVLREFDPERFPGGSGRGMMNSVFRRIADQESAVAETAKMGTPVQKFLARAQANTLRGFPGWPFISDVLEKDYQIPGDKARSLARSLYKAARESFAHPGFVDSPTQALGILDKIGGALRVHGLPGLTETMRAMTVSDIKNIGVGPIKLGKVPGFSKIPDHWGFLPDRLMSGALKLRFTLNPLFEARLFTKGQFIRGAAEELTPVAKPLARMQELGVYDEASKLFARVEGWNPSTFDDAERAVLNSGLLGYNATNHAMYDYWRVYKREIAELTARGRSAEEADASALAYLRGHGRKLWSYGARSPLEKSVNFLFFPFSFEKKLVGLAADYLTAQPVRTLLAHHAMKMVDAAENMDPKQKDKLSSVLKKYAPLYHQLDKMNAFAHGISFGEFGLNPFGAVYKPLADSLGVPIEVVRGALMPSGVGPDDGAEFNKVIKRLIPGIAATQSILSDATEQARIATRQQPETADSQVDDYYSLKNAMEEKYAGLSVAFGGQNDIESFMRSSKVPAVLKMEYQKDKLALDARFPAGAQHAAEFSNVSALQQIEVDRILRKAHKTRAEQAVVALEAERVRLQSLPLFQDDTPAAKLIRGQLLANGMRTEALKLLGRAGPDFGSLWSHLGYANEFGPIEVQPNVAA